MCVAMYFGSCAGSSALRARFGLPQNRESYQDKLIAIKATGLRFMWQFIGFPIWTIKTYWRYVDITKECFHRSRWLVISNLTGLAIIGTLYTILLLITLMCFCPLILVNI